MALNNMFVGNRWCNQSSSFLSSTVYGHTDVRTPLSMTILKSVRFDVNINIEWKLILVQVFHFIQPITDHN